jgi:hypothetical protein
MIYSLTKQKENMKHLQLFEQFVAGLNEAANVNTEKEFVEYAMSVLKKAHGKDFDEKIANRTIKGILNKAKDDYGAAIGMLTSGLSEATENLPADHGKKKMKHEDDSEDDSENDSEENEEENEEEK